MAHDRVTGRAVTTTLGLDPLLGKARTAYLACLDPAVDVVALEGSVRSGKTIASLLAWVAFTRNAPPGLLLMTGRTERTIEQNLIAPLLSWLGPGRCRYRAGVLWLLGREVRIVGATNELARTKVQGVTLAGAYVDEAAILPESFVRMVLTRLSVPGARMILTCNPEGPRHWLKRSWIDGASRWVQRDGTEVRTPGPHPLAVTRVSFTLDDNPSLTEAYKERQRASHTGAFYRRFILGEWAVAEGAIFDAWDHDTMTIDHARLTDPRHPRHVGTDRVLALGVDLGTTNATRGVLLGLSRETEPRLLVLDEWRPAAGLTEAQYVSGMVAWLAQRPVVTWRSPEWVVMDPSRASFRAEAIAQRVPRVDDATNSVVPGLQTVASAIARHRLVVSDIATGLLDELPAYRWDPKASDKGEDRPYKHDDHSIDALRYAAHTTAWSWRPAVDLGG